MPTGINTLFFILLDKIPNNKKVTYGKLVTTIRPTKTEINQVRLAVGRDRLEYVIETTTRCTSLTTTKILLNSVLSTAGGKFMTVDLKDLCYNTPIQDYKYMQFPLSIIPQEIIDQYQLQNIQRKYIVYMGICKGISGLKQAGKLANHCLQSHLLKYGYSPVPRTASLWKPNNKNVMFTLAVNNFGVRFPKKEDAHHLINALQTLYPITFDWTGAKYLGLYRAWDYAK